jgi:hypothetical protein
MIGKLAQQCYSKLRRPEWGVLSGAQGAGFPRSGDRGYTVQISRNALASGLCNDYSNRGLAPPG